MWDSEALGNGNSILLTDSGDVWQFPKKKGSKPKKLSFKVSNQTSEKRILKISSGDNHFLALDEEGKVWSWTDGSDYGFQQGQIGHGDNRKDYREPEMIEDGVFLKHRVIDIECGHFSSYALSSEGLLFG